MRSPLPTRRKRIWSSGSRRPGGTARRAWFSWWLAAPSLNSGRDHFEAGSLEYVKVSELLQRFRDETRYITELIDALLTVDTLYKQQEVQS